MKVNQKPSSKNQKIDTSQKSRTTNPKTRARDTRPTLLLTHRSRRANGSSCNMKVSILAPSRTQTRVTARAHLPDGRLAGIALRVFFSITPLQRHLFRADESPLTPYPYLFPRSSTLRTPPRGSRRSSRSPMSPSCEYFPKTRIGTTAFHRGHHAGFSRTGERTRY